MRASAKWSRRALATVLLAITLATACAASASAQPDIAISVTLELLPGTDIIAPVGKSGAPGDTIYYLFNLQNTGDLATSYHLAVTSPTGWTVILPQHSNKRVGVLQPGQNEIIPMAVTISSSAVVSSQGNVTLTAMADAKPRPSDSATVTTTVVAAPDLPKMVTAPPAQSGVAGAVITYQFQLKNIGVTTADFKLTVSSSPKWQTSLPNNPKGQAGPLAPGAVQMITVVVRVPTNAAIGATCKTTLTALCLARPRTTGEDNVTTTVVAPTAMAINLTPEASSEPAVSRWRVLLSYQGAPKTVRLQAESLRGGKVSINGQEALDLLLPADNTDVIVDLQVSGAVKGEDCLIVSVTEGEELLTQAAAVINYQ